MLEEIIKAIHSYFKAHRFIFRNRLWKWILVPGVIYAFVFIAGIFVFWQSSAYLIEWFFSKTGIRAWLAHENTGWLSFLFLFSRLILQLLLLLLYFSWFKYLFLIVGSPLFAYLSEKTESIILNKEYPFSWKQFGLDIVRGIKIALRNTFWQTFYTLGIIILAFIPVFGWISPLLGMFFECFYLGFSMLDYTNERRGYSAAISIDFINHHKGLAIGNGMVFFLMHAVPLIGWIFAPGYAVVAATLSLQDTVAPQTLQIRDQP